MRRLILPLLLLLPVICLAQNPKYARKKSHETMVYRIPADSTAKYLRLDSIPLDAYYNKTPDYKVLSDTFYSSDLPRGHYLLLSVADNKISAEIAMNTDLLVYVVNNDKHIQFAARDKWGNAVQDLKGWINGRPIDYVESSQTFRLRKARENDIIRISSTTDTVFLEIETDDEAYHSVLKQRWQLFKGTTIGNIITFIPRKVAGLFNGRSYGGNRYRRAQAAGKGFVVFNQPKYKLGDTVKLKAYILKKNKKPYRGNVKAWLQYSERGENVQQLLGNLSPASRGAYLHEFVLRDTLVNDIKYTVVFQDRKGRRLVQNVFSTEDYVLDEVATYSVKSAREKYLAHDSLVFIANAKDANGLNLLDARAKLVLLAGEVEQWHKDSVIIADTLYVEEKKLERNGDTRFVLAGASLPKADMKLEAKVIFRNSNNEIQEESVTVDYRARNNELLLRQEADTIIAEYFVDGKSVAANGTVEILGIQLDLEKRITYPAKLKIDPMADDYWFEVDNDSTIEENIEIDYSHRNELVTASQLSKGDTLGFVLHNPYKIPVYFTVKKGDKVVAMGKGETPKIEWWMLERNERQAYRVTWQYFWAGEERTGYESFGHPYKALTIDVQSNTAVFPGQKDTITASVKDYRNRAASDVNLTAFSYNSQFKKDIRLPSLPYLAKYRLRTSFDRDSYESDEALFEKEYLLGKYPHWRTKFSIDTMLYYQMLFPKDAYIDVMSLSDEHYPQVSVHVVQKGVPEEIYTLHLNRTLVYYNGVTDKKNYAFFAPGGYLQIGIRLYDRFIEIDSIYIQPNYKHDLVFDLDKLPSNTKVEMRGKELTPAEVSELEMSLWQLRNVDYYNNGYVWQYGEAVRIKDGFNHIIGPFSKFDSLHYYIPGKFDIRFPYEPGYQYRISHKLVRFEKMPVFAKSSLPVKLKPIKASWILGDTVMTPPVISDQTPKAVTTLPYNDEFRYHYKSAAGGKSKLVFRPKKDTTLRYVVMYPANKTLSPVVLYGTQRTIYGLEPGHYTLLLVRQDLNAMEIPVEVKENQTTYLKTGGWSFIPGDIMPALLAAEEMRAAAKGLKQEPVKATPVYTLPSDYNSGNNSIDGRIVDAKGGKAIPAAAIHLKGSSFGVAANNDGAFQVMNLKAGDYVLIVSAIGYATEEVPVKLDNNITGLTVHLNIANSDISEVVVTAYGVQKKASFTSAMSVVRSEALAGKVAGLDLSGTYDANVYDSTMANYNIQIRGIRTISGVLKPLYVVDGIAYEDMPANLIQDDIINIEVLNNAAATALYGSRAADGVVIVTTKTKTMRSQFRDYAFWQPQLFTDEQGVAKFVVTYPDNVTSWQTYVIGIDKKNRTGTGVNVTRAYKPVMAQLSLPQFAIAGDSMMIIAKTMNYTKDAYKVNADMSLFSHRFSQWNFDLQPAESFVKEQAVIAAGDTMKLQFNIATSTGFKDGEERILPVLESGTQEASGHFYIMQQDTSIHFTAQRDSKTELYIRNNTMDVLLNELQHLQRYPYFCMEQVASKVKGYRMEKKIREVLQQEFRHEKDMRRLIERLQKAQHYDGGWSWWEKGNPDIYITNYILQALLPLKDDALMAVNLRNGYLFLQNRLPGMKRDVLLYSLSTLAEAGHVLDYQPYLSRIHFDSLNVHQQWMFVRIKQSLQLEHETELGKLLNKKVPTMTGGVYWGEETFTWYDNHVATTVLAYTVLEKEEKQQQLLPQIAQYFLESRYNAYWRNTVESASITEAILPRIIKENKRFNEPAVIDVKGDTSFTVKHFPFDHSFSRNIKNLSLQKQGGGLTYLTLYQEWWNKTPAPVRDRFAVNTYFQDNGQTMATLKAGERVKMKVDVNALQHAEYVMIEIPIPAGCIIVNKRTDGYTEYFKDKVVIFRDVLKRGSHDFGIELECRYAGRYTINPAKASLMYFPTFFGRNEMRAVDIR